MFGSVYTAPRLRLMQISIGSAHIYRPQTKFAKVMFSQVSVCPRGGGSAPLHAGIHTPWADTPLGRHPLRQTPVYAGIHPPAQCMLGDTVNKRAVRIPLECILVSIGLGVGVGVGVGVGQCKLTVNPVFVDVN